MRIHSLIIAAPSLVALAFAFGGCPTHVLSPPSGFLPLDGPATLERGEHAVGLEGGYGQATFGPEVVGGTVRYRGGLDDDLEVQGETSLAWVLGEGAADTFRGILSGRVGLKGTMVPDWPHLAWTVGLGGGGSAGGGFAAFDAGVVLGYENPYLVPFGSLSGIGSVPIGARDVDITRADAEPGDDRVIDRPHATFGLRGTFGLRVPAGIVDVYAGVNFVWLIDVRGEDEFFGGPSGGVSLRF